MPSASRVKRVPHAGIQVYDSRNWKRGPPTLNITYMTAVSTKTTSDQANATIFASCGFVCGISATTPLPTSGSSVSTLRKGKELIPASPPASPRSRAGHLRAWTGRRTGRTRSARVAVQVAAGGDDRRAGGLLHQVRTVAEQPDRRTGTDDDHEQAEDGGGPGAEMGGALLGRVVEHRGEPVLDRRGHQGTGGERADAEQDQP